MTDISLMIDQYKFNLRTCAVVHRGNEILICRIEGRDWHFLPGGRIKANESSLDALERELGEEIGSGFRVIRSLVCAENFFEVDGVHCHEICFFYEVEWYGGELVRESHKDIEVFEWVSVRDLHKINLKPELIKKYIIENRRGVELLIRKYE